MPIFVEPVLLPRFIVEITNKGKNVDSGEISIYYANYPHEDPSSHSTIETPIDFAHKDIRNFKHGETRKFCFSNNYRFTAPGDYAISLKTYIGYPETDQPNSNVFKFVLIYDCRFPNVIRVYPWTSLPVLIGIATFLFTAFIALYKILITHL